jgi:hypothetical protein
VNALLFQQGGKAFEALRVGGLFFCQFVIQPRKGVLVFPKMVKGKELNRSGSGFLLEGKRNPLRLGGYRGLLVKHLVLEANFHGFFYKVEFPLQSRSPTGRSPGAWVSGLERQAQRGGIP